MSHSYYYIAGDVLAVSGRFCDYTTTLGAGTQHSSSVPGRQVFTFTDLATADTAGMDCVISHTHEQRHHMDLQTTSFGLLTWRVQRHIADSLLALLRETRRIGIPLRRNSFNSEAGFKIVGLDGRPFVDWLMELAPALKSVRCEIDVDSTVSGLKALLRFQDLLLGAPNLTIGGAVAVANTALRHLRLHYDLDSDWTFTTSLPEGSKCVPIIRQANRSIERALDGREVLEFSAFMAECLFARLFHRAPQKIRRWQTLLGGLDRGWLPPFGDDGLPPQRLLNMYRLVVDYSLSGPGDPALRGGGTVNIESLLPQWRFVDALQRLQSDRNADPIALLVDDPIWDSGAYSVQNIYADLAESYLNGPGAGTYSAAKGEQFSRLRAADPDLSFVPYRLQEYRRAFAARAADPVAVSLPTSADESLFHQALLEFFDDHVQTNRPVGVNEAYTGYLYESAVVEYVAAETAQTLCDSGSRSVHVVRVLRQYGESTGADFARENKEPPDICESLRAIGLPDWTFLADSV